ncbi:MAG: hypothetical protein WEB30_04875, partial [Cyclobacteriaceae bacterium]
MIRNDVIMMALPRWDSLFHSTALSLSKEISRTNRVFYIDNPFTLKEVVTGFMKKPVRQRLLALFFGINKYRRIDPSNENLIAVTPRFVLPVNFLPQGKISSFLSSINNAIVSWAIRSAIKKYQIKDFIFINSYNPFYLEDADKFKPVCTIYHCVDNISESKYISRHGSRLEQKMIRDFDLTLSTSRKLSQYAQQFSKNTFYLPNGADFKLFRCAFD